MNDASVRAAKCNGSHRDDADNALASIHPRWSERALARARRDSMSNMSTWKSLWREMVAGARKLSIGGYLLIVSLLALRAGVIVFADLGWSLSEGTDVPTYGYAAIAAGIVLSLALGIGLMALCFCSSRFGYDEPAKIVRSDNHEHLAEDKHSGSPL
jgi:hypothetical protein